MRRIAAFAVGSLMVLGMATAANARTAEPNLSPEYTWPVDLPKMLATVEAAAPTPQAPSVHDRQADSPEVDVTSPAPNVLAEMTGPFHYTGPTVETGVPGGTVITDRPVGAPSDPRVLHCTGGVSFGAGGTFPAASIGQAGLVDQLIADGVCSVVS